MRNSCSTYRQRGAALVVGLIFLVILTLLGITAMQTTTLEERIAGNSRDRDVAFQADEATLRDGERDIMCKNAAGTGNCTRAVPISGRTGFDQNCTNGLCYLPTKTPVWKNYPGMTFGKYTGAIALAGLAAQPTYLIEVFRKWPPGTSGWRHYYQITAQSAGGSSNTRVILQEVFTP